MAKYYKSKWSRNANRDRNIKKKKEEGKDAKDTKDKNA